MKDDEGGSTLTEGRQRREGESDGQAHGQSEGA
jgi:hypothetical protein